MKIVAITSGQNVPSSRFRVRQYIEPFATRGHHVIEYCPAIAKYAGPRFLPPENAVSRTAQRIVYGGVNTAKLLGRAPGVIASRAADATWLEREMIAEAFTLERFLGKPLVFDVDDAIWAGGDQAARSAERIAERADVVLAGNSYIAEWFGCRARDIRVVPTGLDTARFSPAAREGARRFRLVWTGLAYNFTYLYAIEDLLAPFLTQRDAEIVIIAERSPQFRRIDPNRVVFVRWSPENEAQALRSADVGLMPLPDDEWSRGKCSLKMIQYMATGLPAVVSPVGMNRDILAMAEVGIAAQEHDDWRAALDLLWGDEPLRARLGSAGRDLAVSHFSRDAVFRIIADVFESLS